MKKILFFIVSTIFILSISISAKNPQISNLNQFQQDTIATDTISKKYKKIDEKTMQVKAQNKSLDSLLLEKKKTLK